MVNFNPSPWLAIVPIIIKIFARCEAAALTLAVSLTVFNSSSLLGQLRLLSTKNLFLFIDLTAKGISGILRLSKRGLFFSLERGGVLIISSELILIWSGDQKCEDETKKRAGKADPSLVAGDAWPSLHPFPESFGFHARDVLRGLEQGVPVLRQSSGDAPSPRRLSALLPPSAI
eukprot:m.234517 g.234517  ORF g.234517 m.234517 type:complete len:174 (+) comp54306_c0_seq6:458-979(+)